MVTCPLFDPKAYQRNSETFFLDNITPHQSLINYLATALLKPDFCLLKNPKKPTSFYSHCPQNEERNMKIFVTLLRIYRTPPPPKKFQEMVCPL